MSFLCDNVPKPNDTDDEGRKHPSACVVVGNHRKPVRRTRSTSIGILGWLAEIKCGAELRQNLAPSGSHDAEKQTHRSSSLWTEM
jgi:hypothetical protein